MVGGVATGAGALGSSIAGGGVAGGAAATAGFPWLSVGLSVGWIVGSWLFGPKPRDDQQVFDPGAEEMPRPNQALRGSTIPIAFGTNRMPANITWMKNWTVIRHESRESAGGGKGGGSGMGGKGGARGQTNVSYEYKVDCMMHFGMTPEPVSLFGAWIGGERLSGNTIAAISGLVSENQVIFQSQIARSANASLSFVDAFFHGAGPTGGAYLNWEYFEQQEGLAARWPHTTYIGFQQLNLGGSAMLPQLTAEIGPGSAEIDFNSGFLGDDPGSESTQFMCSQAPVKTTGNVQYVPLSMLNSFKLVKVSNGVVSTPLDNTQFNADAIAVGLNPGGSPYTFSILGSFSIPNTRYVVVFGYDIGTGTRLNWAFVTYSVADNGTLTPLGGYAGRSNQQSGGQGIVTGGLGGNQTTTDNVYYIMLDISGSNHKTKRMKLPTLSAMISSATVEDTPAGGGGNAPVDDRVLDLTPYLGAYFGEHQSKRNYQSFGWFLPAASVDILGLTYQTYFYYHVSRADVQEHIDDPAAADANSYINANKTAYPNGFIGRIRIDEAGAPEIVNADWLDALSGAPAVPFDDASKDSADVDNFQAEYDNPSCIKLTSGAATGGYLIIFTKRFNGTTDLAPTGDKIKVRAFIFNPFDGTAKQYAFSLGSTYDTVADVGAGDRYNYTNYQASVYYDEATQEIIHHRHAQFSTAGTRHVLARFGELNISGGADVTPPYIIFHILSHPAFKAFGYVPADIDADSYGEAVQHCINEGILVSAWFGREEDVLKVIDMCLSLYGGYLTERDGKVFFGVAQFDSNPLTGRVLDNHHLVQDNPDAPKPPVRTIIGGKQDTFNKVKVNFLNRDLEYRQDFIEVNDEVDQDLNGIRAHEFPPMFTMGKDTATKLGTRTLWTNLYNRPIFEFILGWKDADLSPGTVITLVDSFDDYLRSGKVVRLTHFQEKKRGQFYWRAVEEIPYYNSASTMVQSVTQASSNPLFGPAMPPADFRMYELPQEFQGADSLLYVGYNQLSATMGARLYVSAQSTTGFARVDDAQPFIISGRLASDFPSNGALMESVTMYLMPASEFTVTTPVYAQSFQLDDVDAAARGLGAGLVWVGSEMLAYEGVTLLAQNKYRFDKVYRGWGGTNIHAHNSGDYWHKHGGGMFTYKYNADKIGTTIYYKVTPYNFNGVEYDVSSIAAKEYKIRGTYYRPQNAAPIRTFIETPITGTASDNIGDLALRGVTSGGCDLTFTWPDAALVAGYGAGGYGVGSYGRFASDADGHAWRVEVLSANNAVVRSTTVATGFFTYNLETNSADFNAWQGAISLRVTPFNGFGDAIRNQTKVLSLFSTLGEAEVQNAFFMVVN